MKNSGDRTLNYGRKYSQGKGVIKCSVPGIILRKRGLKVLLNSSRYLISLKIPTVCIAGHALERNMLKRTFFAATGVFK